MSTANKSDLMELHGKLVDYANIYMAAVLDGVEEMDSKLFTTYLAMVKHDSVSASDDKAATEGDEISKLKERWS